MSEKELYYTDLPVGQILKRTREHYGQSLADIERALRIRASQIEAIEEGHTEKLPGRVYAIGFVKSYSEYLGLDGSKMVHLFKTQSGAKDETPPTLQFRAPASENKVPPVPVAITSMVVGLLIIAIWLTTTQGHDRGMVTEVPEVPTAIKDGLEDDFSQSSEPAQLQKPDPALETPVSSTDETATAPADENIKDEAATTLNPATTAGGVTVADPLEQPEQDVPAETSAVQDEPEQTASISRNTDDTDERTANADNDQRIILNIIQNSWVEIRDKSGSTIVSRVLEAGEQYYVPDRADLTMSLGNAGGVQLQVDGKTLSALGRKGDVKKNIPLDVERLKKIYGKKS